MPRIPRPFVRFALLSACVLTADTCAAQTMHADWQLQQVGFATKPAFDFDAQGRIHIMGMTEAHQGVVWYDVADSVVGPWNPQTVASGYFYGPGDLRVDGGGVAHIAYHDHDATNAAHISVANGVPTVFDVPSPSHDGWDNSLAFDNSGRLRMSSVDPSGFGAEHSLQYSEFDGATWSLANVDSSDSFMYGFNSSLAFDSHDQPSISYTNAGDWTSPGDLKIARRFGEVWQISTVVTDGIRGRFSSLAIDDSDRPHVAWLDIDENDHTLGVVRYGVLDNGVWSIETVDDLRNIELGFSGGRKQVSLALDDAGAAHLAYGDKRVVKYATRGDTQWDSVTVAETEEDFFNGLTVLRLSPLDQTPAVTFWQPDPDVAGVVWLAAPRRPVFSAGDIDHDGSLTAADIDELFAAVRDSSPLPVYDVNGDGVVSDGDSRHWVEQLAGTRFGDANLDLAVDEADLNLWNGSLFLSDTGWGSGDFNGDGVTDVSDFNLWNDNRFVAAAQVPEPNSVSFLTGLIGIMIVCCRQQQRNVHA